MQREHMCSPWTFPNEVEVETPRVGWEGGGGGGGGGVGSSLRSPTPGASDQKRSIFWLRYSKRYGKISVLEFERVKTLIKASYVEFHWHLKGVRRRGKPAQNVVMLEVIRRQDWTIAVTVIGVNRLLLAVTVGVVGLGFILWLIAPIDAYFISTSLPLFLHWKSGGAVGKPSPT